MKTDAFHLESEFADLGSAEEFLNYFGVDYDPAVVRVTRLHILQRFHDYLDRRDEAEVLTHAECGALLARAYEDFVDSDALTEKVFRVHKRASGIATVPVSAIGHARR